jgi:MFS superfamily sulfate permease-like transporter
MSAVESVSVARTFAKAQEPPIDANRELIAIGAANMGAGLFQGFPGGGGTSQTAVNAQAGAKTQLSSLVTCCVVILALTLLAPVFSLLPQATLGATVFVAALGLVRLDAFRRIAFVRPRDAVLAALAALSVVVLGPLQGILMAVVLSMLTLLFEMNHPQVYVMGRKHGSTDFRDLQHYPQDETFPGLLIVHPVGRIYFANVERLHSRLLELIQSAPEPVKILLLDASSISDLEYTVLDGLSRLGRELEGYGVTMWTAALNPKPLEMVERYIDDPKIKSERLFLSVLDGVNAYQERYLYSRSDSQ